MNRLSVLRLYFTTLSFFISVSFASAAPATEDQMGRAVYYVLFAGLVGAGILATRRNVSHSLKQGALWMLMILGLAAVYTVRYELQDIGSKLTAGLIPGHTAVFSDENGLDTTILYKGSDGHFHADLQVGNRTVSMLVDTGASVTTLAYEDAEQLGLKPENLSYFLTSYTANGEAQSAMARIHDVRLGAIERSEMRVNVAKKGAMRESLLGMNFLNSLSAFTFEGDRMKLKN